MPVPRTVIWPKAKLRINGPDLFTAMKIFNTGSHVVITARSSRHRSRRLYVENHPQRLA